MHHSVRRLSRMTRAMFHLSVGRHVTLKPTLHEGDIRECAEQALYEIQQLAQEKEIQLDVDFEPSFAPLFMDSGQIEQVILNLLENAYKFTPRFGSIVLKGYPFFWDRRATNVFSPPEADRRVAEMRTPNAYRIDIVDSGPGISVEHLKSIFEEYVSYSGGQDRSRGGLGLAICRMILSQHQGRIWAENNRSGAVFSFVLPLRPPEGVQPPPEIAYTANQSELSLACI
jgi:signal transduction histidine kinase